jgi:glycerol-3-phosphate acyltransferase PlsY
VFGCLLGVVLFIALTEWGSLGSLLGVSGLSIIQLCVFVLRYQDLGFNAYLVCLYMMILAINVLTWVAHKENLARLFAGEEHHTSIKKLAKKKSK